jgi:hypothetical protein
MDLCFSGDGSPRMTIASPVVNRFPPSRDDGMIGPAFFFFPPKESDNETLA